MKIIVVNFKAYKSAIGKNAVRLAKLHDRIARKYNVKIIVAVQAADIANVAKNVRRVDVIGQHVDGNDYGQHTGSVLAEDLKQNGAKGSLVNHAEKRIKIGMIKKIIARCKKLGMYAIVCVPSIKQAKIVARYKPKYIAYEVPSLIGTGRPISRVRPRDVKIFAREMRKRKIIPLCGAGINNGEDVRIAIELGCKGVLLASAVTTAKNPGKVLRDLAK